MRFFAGALNSWCLSSTGYFRDRATLGQAKAELRRAERLSGHLNPLSYHNNTFSNVAVIMFEAVPRLSTIMSRVRTDFLTTKPSCLTLQYVIRLRSHRDSLSSIQILFDSLFPILPPQSRSRPHYYSALSDRLAVRHNKLSVAYQVPNVELRSPEIYSSIVS